MMMIHTLGIYYSIRLLASAYQGKIMAFIGNCHATKEPTLVCLPTTKSWEWHKGNATADFTNYPPKTMFIQHHTTIILMMNFQSLNRWNPLCNGFILSHFRWVCCMGQYCILIHMIVCKSLVKYCKMPHKCHPWQEDTGLGQIKGGGGNIEPPPNL